MGKMEMVWKSLEKLWFDGTQLLKNEKPHHGNKPNSSLEHIQVSMIKHRWPSHFVNKVF
jgi:hypothetical protein